MSSIHRGQLTLVLSEIVDVPGVIEARPKSS